MSWSRRFCRWFLVFLAGLIVGLGAGLAGWVLSTDPYNRFARSYNEYVRSESQGVVDLKKLHKMRAAWRELEKSAGWPDEPCR